MTQYQVRPYTLLEGFEDVSEWTVGAGTAVNDTTLFKSGTQSIRLTSTSGGNCNITKTISADLSAASTLYYWVYVADGTLDNISDVQVILSNDSGFTNYYFKTISQLHEGWNRLQIGRSQWTASGSPSWNSTMVRLRVRLNAIIALVAVVNVDAMYAGGYNRPKVVITYDDGFDTQYTQGYAYMKKYRMRGTLYLISDRIDTAGFLTTAQCQEMYDAGWDMSNHTQSHANMSTLLTQAANEDEIAGCQSFLESHGWIRNGCHRHLAYPFGAYTTAFTLPAVAAQNLLTARTVIDRTQANEMDNYQLITRQAPIHTTLIATALSWVDRTIADGGVLILCLHELVETPTDQNKWGIADFQTFIDYLQRKSSEIDVVPLSEWYNGIEGGRRGTDFRSI
jgi:peptidoglycan/xylan/chitin deacetylase (PgdA/CDA1 family)